MFLLRKKRPENLPSRTLRTYGLSESAIREKLKGIAGSLEILSHPKGVDLRIVVEGNDEKLLKGMGDAVEGQVRQRLGKYVFGADDDKIEQVVGKALADQKMTLAVAESCTGGLICHWLTNVPGSSEYFKHGIIAYSDSVKLASLGVSEEILKRFGAVSRETVTAMAKGVREVSKAGIGLAVTGIAGPGGGSAEKPVGLVYIGLARDAATLSEEYHFTGGREMIKIQASQAALDLLRKNLRKSPRRDLS